MATPWASPISGEDPSIIMSLHWFAQHNGAKQYLVWTDNSGRLRFFNPSVWPAADPWTTIEDIDDKAWDGTTLERKTITEPWQGEQSVVWGGNLFLANGYDPVIVYDGDKTSNAGFSTGPSAPTASPVDYRLDIFSTQPDIGLGETGLGLEDSDNVPQVGVYAYRYSWVNERGQESPISNPSELILIRTNSDVHRGLGHVSLQAGPPGTVARRLYRTKNLISITSLASDTSALNISAESANYYYHSDITHNETTEIDDCKIDSGLGSLLDTSQYGAIPSSVKYMATFKNTMFYAGMTPNTVQYSRPLFPEVCPPDNTIECGSSAHGPITGMYATKNALIVFKTRSIYLIKGDPVNGFFTETLTEDTGCVAPMSIREIPGLGVSFLSQDAICLLEGALENTGTETKITEISTPISPYIDKINFAAALNVRAAVYHKDMEFWMAVPTIGSQENNLVLVFHYDIGAWSIRYDFPIKCLVETNDHRGYLMFGSSDTSAYGIHVYTQGVKVKGVTAEVEPKWESVHHALNTEYGTVRPLGINAYAIAISDNDLQVDFRVNRSVYDARSTPALRDQQEFGEEQAVYDTATWGSTTRWGFFRPVIIKYNITSIDKARSRELQVAFSATEHRMHLVGYSIEVEQSERDNILPGNAAITDERT